MNKNTFCKCGKPMDTSEMDICIDCLEDGYERKLADEVEVWRNRVEALPSEKRVKFIILIDCHKCGGDGCDSCKNTGRVEFDNTCPICKQREADSNIGECLECYF